jgi:glycosyltransferase involved in cell wall biosynthesis
MMDRSSWARSSIGALPAGRGAGRWDDANDATRVDRIVINGRFMSQPISGVQRFARELVLALDGALASEAEGPSRRVELHMPSEPSNPLALKTIQSRIIPGRSGHAWEQLDLSRSARGAVLVSLANSAPLAHRNQIVTVHDAALRVYPDAFTLAYRLWYRTLYAGLRLTAARFATVSQFSAGEIARCFAVPRQRISVIPDGSDHIDRIEAQPDILLRRHLLPRSYIVAIGGQSARKNLQAVETALSIMGDRRPTLVVVGGRNSAIFSPLGTALGPEVVDVGYVTDGECKALYENALCLVYPSLYEGFGLPPVEAMRCGCPVIASGTSSLPEVCGEAVLYCDPRDPETIARQIARIRDSQRLRLDLIERGHERCSLFEWQDSAIRLMRLIAEVAEMRNHVP